MIGPTMPRPSRTTSPGYASVHWLRSWNRSWTVEPVLADQTGRSVAGFLRRTVGWFARRGIAVARVLTDNGRGYRSHHFQVMAGRCRVRLSRTRPYRPQTNGTAERFIPTLIRGWAYAASYPSSWRRTLALRPWLQHYNIVRPHAALGYQPPCVRFPRVAQ